jgi:16S rRNA (cytosine1402-N4)-methyltransferase
VPVGPAGHTPVLLSRVRTLFEPALSRPSAILLDATVGLGGHAEELLAAHPQLRLVGIDRDPLALQRCRERLQPYRARATFVHAVYDRLTDVLKQLDIEFVDGVLLDLGVSSLQLDDPARGFAYARDVPLDMRMDPTSGQTAADVLNRYSVQDLARVLRDYGEERFARRIAATIGRARTERPLASSAQLVELIRAAIPAPARRRGGNPAKRTFQALRIEVNDELGTLSRALPAAITALAAGGRIVVLSYHSLEDRLVKRALVAGARPAPPPVPLPAAVGRPVLRLLTRGAERPDEDERAANPRAASARLRAAERVPDAA